MEAAAIDGAGPWQRFRDIVVPTIKPILLILTALSVLWDFRVFTQIYVLQRAGGITRDTNLLGVYAYRISIGANRVRHGRRGRHRDGAHHAAADALLPPLRWSARRSCDARPLDDREVTPTRRRSPGAATWSPNLRAGCSVFLIASSSPSTGWSLRRSAEASTSSRRPAVPAVAGHARELPQGVRRGTSSGPLRRQPDRHARSPWCSRCSSPSWPRSPSPASGSAAARRSSSRSCSCRWCPAEALIISLFKVLDGWQLINTIIGLTLDLPRVRPAVHDLDAARLRRQRAQGAGGGGDGGRLVAAAGVHDRSRCRSSRPGSWPPACSRSSRHGTSSSSPSSS